MKKIKGRVTEYVLKTFYKAISCILITSFASEHKSLRLLLLFFPILQARFHVAVILNILSIVWLINIPMSCSYNYQEITATGERK